MRMIKRNIERRLEQLKMKSDGFNNKLVMKREL